ARTPGHPRDHPGPAARRRGDGVPRAPPTDDVQPGLPAAAGGHMTTGSPDPGTAPDALPEGAADAVARSRMSQLAGQDFSLAEAIGGVRGLVESVAPGLVFVVVYLVSGQELVPPL